MAPKVKKFTLGLFLALFLFFNLAGTLFLAESAEAAAPTSIIEDIPRKTSEVWEKIKQGFKIGIYSAALNTVQYVTRKLAYDSAVWLASGGKGQEPLAFNQPFGEYIKSIGSGAFGTFIDEMGKPLGLDLCKIPDARLELLLRLGLRKKYCLTPGECEPKCNWEKFTKGWSAETAKSMYGGWDQLAERFNASIKSADTDMGIFIDAQERIDNLVATERYKKEKEREEGQGAKGLTDLISGNIKTPATVMADVYRKEAEPNKTKEDQDKALSKAFSSGMEQMIPSTISVFLNTLLGQMVQNFFTQGMLPGGACLGGWAAEHGFGDESCKDQEEMPLAEDYFGSGAAGFSGRRRAEQIFSGLLVTPVVPMDKYNVLANFTNCPDNPGLENCAADEGLAAAVNRGTMGAPMTVKEAMDGPTPLLHSEWKFLPPSRAEDNADPNCYTRAYCYRNMKILRQARVVSLGFEIAAKNSNPDKPWTLKEVVDGFDDCKYAVDGSGNRRLDARGNPIVIDDPSGHPFCRLIDPNWVLKAPPARCDNFAYNTLPLGPDMPVRQQSCVDLKTCVGYNADGTCYAYGYCTREQNEWRFNLDKCEAQNRTCRAFTDSAGGSVAYLYRTLNTGYCTADNVGCRAYSLERDINGSWTEPAGDYNPYIYFNNKLSQSCSSGSAGCSAFKAASSTETSLYLRKAPYYLGCYAPRNNILDAIAEDKTLESLAWPKTRADLDKLEPSEECQNYSPACIPEEVGCSYFTPVTYRGAKVPGKFKPAEVSGGEVVAWNDQCDAKCVGYAAYREMPSNYSNGQDVDYIIPSSGAACRAAEEGCSSFTNLATTTGGVESVEYYSYLRPCISPDAAKQKTFYTYEGKEGGGYQLKVFNLQKDDFGAPKYWYRTSADLTNYNNLCNQAKYQAGAADPDCRQFNDDAGAVYYKLLSKTIAVSEQCTPYRLNNTELEPAPALGLAECTTKKGFWNSSANSGAGECQLCFQNGEYKDGYCFYTGLPFGNVTTAGSSQACSAQAETCRAYKGNAGNNIRHILEDNFEAPALVFWSSGASVYVSGESTQPGGHSLGYNGPAGAESFGRDNLDLVPGASYDLTFWAKGDAQNLTVNLKNNAVVSLGTVTLGDNWRLYHLGPLALGGTATGTRLSFDASGGAGNVNVFVDNLQLTEVANYLYLVKKTLKVDPICDSRPEDNLPGEALGCAEYQDQAGKPYYLTGFNYLCRENAIGCTALLNTYNTADSGIRIYNVWFAGAPGATVKKNIAGGEYSCKIPLGEKGCYLNIFGADKSQVTLAGGVFNASTVYLPADTPTATPIYLVASKANTCHQADLGCSIAGTKQATPAGVTYVTTTIKNDPALYEQITCTQEAEGCSAFNYRGGAMYFKDPQATGQKICAYRNGVDVSGAKSNGWFWKNVGKCKSSSGNFGNYCSADNDCAAGEKCEKKGDWPCYPDYRFDETNYGLWSYGATSSYSGFVGECPAEQSGCTEFIDHNDNNKKSYFIDNDKLKAAQAGCNGQVSQRYGCILLDNTELPNKLWNTAESYTASTKNNFALTTPVTSAQNDANLIVKVVRDRGCAEWLQCQNSHREWNSEEGRFKTICDGVGRCNRLTPVTEQSDATECASWVNGTHDYAGQILSDTVYRSRDVSWGGHDYSGYSIWGQYPAEELEQMNLSAIATSSKWSLVKRVSCGGVNCGKNALPTDYVCEIDQAPCGAGREGTCQNKICVQTPSGSNNTEDFAQVNSPVRQYCRAYPEKDSPFPNNTELVKSQAFAGVNKCNEVFSPTSDPEGAGACDCYYLRVNYGDFTTKFLDFYQPNSKLRGGTPKATDPQDKDDRVLTGICVNAGEAGPGSTGKDGMSCSKDEDCQVNADTPGGTCARKTKQQKYIGRAGFCLEFDESKVINSDTNQHPCLTWLPVDQLSGVPDPNNQFVDAGFDSQAMGYSVGPFYFVKTERWELRKTFKVKIAGNIDCDGHDNWEKDSYLKDQYSQCETDDGTSFPNSCWDRDPDRAYKHILKYCWNTDCKYDNNPNANLRSTVPFPSIVCPSNYKPAELTKFVQTCAASHGCKKSFGDGEGQEKDPCVDEQEDFIEMEYKCVPVNGDGWYNDPGGSLLRDNYTISSGWRGSGKNVDMIDPVNVASDGSPLRVREEEQTRGVTLFNMAEDGNNKAWTNRLWSNSDYEYFPNAAGKISYNKDCTPFGASSLKSVPGVNDVVRQGNCADKSEAVNGTSQWLYSGGIEHGKDRLQNIFAKSYGRYAQGESTQKACLGAFAVDGKSCGSDADCLGNNLCPNTGDNPIGGSGDRDNICPTTGFWIESARYCGGVESITAEMKCLSPWSRYDYDDNDMVQSKYNQFPGNVLGTSQQPSSKCEAYSVPGQEKMESRDTGFDPGWDVAYQRGKDDPPIVMPVRTGESDCKQNPNGSGQLCREGGKDEGITLNNKTEGPVKVTGQPAKINLKFYAFADKDHMPLRRVMIDWGDGNIVPRDGYFRNHRGARQGRCKEVPGSQTGAKKCYGHAYEGLPFSPLDSSYNVPTEISCYDDTDCKFVPQCVKENNAPLFSFILDKTCDSSYFYQEYTYNCRKGGPGYNPTCGAYTAEFPQGCCIYTPKVQVLDNWGWCNGSCEPGGGCYKDDPVEDYCASGNVKAWTNFNGQVYVKPL